jgi:hypothetical protein
MVFNLEDELHTIIDSLEFIAAKNNNKIINNLIPQYPSVLETN